MQAHKHHTISIMSRRLNLEIFLKIKLANKFYVKIFYAMLIFYYTVQSHQKLFFVYKNSDIAGEYHPDPPPDVQLINPG